MKLLCQFSIKDFSKYLYGIPNVTELLLSHLINPSLLIKQIFEISLEVCWEKQLQGYNNNYYYTIRLD